MVRRGNQNGRRFHKKGVHLALDDIRESIAEMVNTRQHVFNI
ncbi:oligoribonuclease [Paraglaciecola psychrophila 170]|uniref:Oligoribonuclease n=1 Tax=Paraglaciecola psychrophila 170 TaxID=1129794 RepID=M4RSC8_9ALTE|nr:oligoribonuclease [Paraglaciecola psychrophila 170]